jgi:DNA invertase Pin-like site-specific DNA recombinase
MYRKGAKLFFMSEKQFKACIYARLSREDGDKAESDSISSQRAMIREYLSRQDDIEIVAEKVDDGYSGVSFVEVR